MKNEEKRGKTRKNEEKRGKTRIKFYFLCWNLDWIWKLIKTMGTKREIMQNEPNKNMKSLYKKQYINYLEYFDLFCLIVWN